MENTREQHLAKTQFYRWYQLYERDLNEQRINNQMKILCDDVVIKTSAGEVHGKQHYPEYLKVYEGWKNAHHVQNIKVDVKNTDTLQLEADIRYQNIQPNGQKASYTIHYTTTLKKETGNLPRFSSIQITPTGETKDEYSDAYPTNRTKSLMYYWLALIERLDGDVTPFKVLLAKDFELNFSTGKINSIEILKKWLNKTSRELAQSNHYPEDFSIKPIMENEYEATAYFDWKGLSKDGKSMKGKTKHLWYVVDNPNDQFAKILKADVKQVEPYKTIEE